jgi:hypothetical protein
MRAQGVPTGREELIGTVDIRHLHETRWPIMRLLARRYVEEMEMGRYLRRLLATRQWAVVRMVPRTTAQGVPSTRVFDVYGVPAQPGPVRVA